MFQYHDCFRFLKFYFVSYFICLVLCPHAYFFFRHSLLISFFLYKFLFPCLFVMFFFFLNFIIIFCIFFSFFFSFFLVNNLKRVHMTIAYTCNIRYVCWGWLAKRRIRLISALQLLCSFIYQKLLWRFYAFEMSSHYLNFSYFYFVSRYICCCCFTNFISLALVRTFFFCIVFWLWFSLPAFLWIFMALFFCLSLFLFFFVVVFLFLRSFSWSYHSKINYDRNNDSVQRITTTRNCSVQFSSVLFISVVFSFHCKTHICGDIK